MSLELAAALVAPRFQETFYWGRARISEFVAAVIEAGSVESGVFRIKAIVDASNLTELLAPFGFTPDDALRQGLVARNRASIESLLLAACTDAVDFVFAPQPKYFVVYGDLDQFTTFYAQRRGSLNRVIQPLLQLGFETASDRAPR